jgi:hypothetical protein
MPAVPQFSSNGGFGLFPINPEFRLRQIDSIVPNDAVPAGIGPDSTKE